MRRLAAGALLFFVASCSETPLPESVVLTAAATPTTLATSATTAPPPPATTTTTAAATLPPSTTAPSTDSPPVVDMVPAGDEIEDFIPLVEGYFAVRNWALEHPDQVTEDILATVIEPGSVEMRDTLAEIQDLLDQEAHYEGLAETFVLVEADPVSETTDIDSGTYSVAMTLEYGSTSLTSSADDVITSDTLRRAAWTLHFARQNNDEWTVTSIVRNPTIHAPGEA